MRPQLSLLSFLLLFQNFGYSQLKEFDVPVFAYHRFGDDRFPSTNIKLDVFEEQLMFLKENNYNVLTFGEAIQKWQNGKPIKDKTVVLTIDDGYFSFYENGWPLLKKYGYPATIFIQTETVGGNDFMTWNQIREIQKAGIEVGNHSTTHDHFVNYPADSIAIVFKKDLEIASKAFDLNLGNVPNIYAYPYGEWNKSMEKVLQANGFDAAAVQKSGVFCESSDAYAIPRFPMGGVFATMNGFKSKILMKALVIESTSPEGPFYTDNPPSAKLEISNDQSLNLNGAQFFMEGNKMDIHEKKTGQSSTVITLKPDHKLKYRRTLYTLTAPSKDGKSWHWYSFLWVNPKVKE